MKIIFLDIDGVLNTPMMDKDDEIGKSIYKMSKKLVSMLNEFTDQSNAKLVISSTWRANTLNDTIEFLKSYGIKGNIIGVTPKLTGFRGNEIYEWIRLNSHFFDCEYYEFKDYVILDDDSDMLLWQKDNFIHIDRWVGITPTTIFKMTKILNIELDHNVFSDIWCDRI